MSFQDFRKQYPDLTDEQFNDAVYSKFYSDMPRAEFDASLSALSPELQGQLSKPAPRTAESMEEYLANALRMGPAGAASLFGGIEGIGNVGFMEGMKRTREGIAKLTGGDPDLQAPDALSRALGFGVEAITDPFSYVGTPLLRAGQSLPGFAANLVKSPMAQFVLGTSAGAGAEVGGQLEEVITGKDTGVGRLIGGLGAGVTAGAKGQALAVSAEKVLKSSVDVGKQALSKIKTVKADPASAESAIALDSTRKLLEQIIKGEGRDLNATLDAIKEASTFVSGKNAPLMVSAAENDVVRAHVFSLAQKDPATRARIHRELNQIAEDINKKTDEVLGQRFPTIPDRGVSKASVEAAQAEAQRQALEKSRKAIAERFVYAEDKAQLGERIQRVAELAEATARAEVAPLYQAAIEEARKAGVKMPSQGVSNLYNFVRQNKLRDIFGKGTPLDNKIMQVLSPDEKGVFGAMSFDNVDSLKRAINEIKRSNLSPEQARKIGQLEDVFNASRETMPGNWNQRLRDIDAMYYEKVGIPFRNNNTMKAMDAKKYATDVVPIITKNGEAAADFLRVAGQDGKGILEQALLSKLAMLEDGVLDPVKIGSFIKKNQDVLKHVPEFETTLRRGLVDSEELLTRMAGFKQQAEQANARIAANYLRQTDQPDFYNMTAAFLTDPRARQRTLAELSDLSPAAQDAIKQAMRREVAVLAENSGKGAVAFLKDARNRDGIASLMGKQYTEDLGKIALMMDSLKKVDIENLNFKPDQQVLDFISSIVPGLDLPRVSAQLRDRIASLPQKAVRLLSRVQGFRAKEKFDEMVTELILDPDGVSKLAAAGKGMDFSVNAKHIWNDPAFVNRMKNAVATGFPRGLLAGSRVGAQEPPVKQERKAGVIVGGFQ